MPIDLEQERFIKYQEIYISNRPKDPPDVLPDGSPSAAATKSMTSRKQKYGSSGMSSQGRQNVSSAQSK